MTDVVLIQKNNDGDDAARQVWRNTTKEQMQGLFTQELFDAMVETADGAANENDLFDGNSFSSP